MMKMVRFWGVSPRCLGASFSNSNNSGRAGVRTVTSLAGSNSNDNNKKTKIPACWLDLRGSGLSCLERLCLEECLLHHDDRVWIIGGHHEASPHKYIRYNTHTDVTTTATTKSNLPLPLYIQQSDLDDRNPSAMIVMGIGGKAEKLLNLDLVKQDGVLTIKRFSGGGTVVMDHDCLWTTIIAGRKKYNTTTTLQNPEQNQPQELQLLCPPNPRAIMQWSVDDLFAPMIHELQRMQDDKAKQKAAASAERKTTILTPTDTGDLLDITTMSKGSYMAGPTQSTLVMDTKSCCGLGTSGETLQIPRKTIAILKTNDDDIHDETDATTDTETAAATEEDSPLFSLREHDYVMNNSHKVAGNAQAIVKQGWLHHTSWLWDFDVDTMEYLRLPDKRPDYRQDRPHSDFLVSLQTKFPLLKKADFYTALKIVCDDYFQLQPVTAKEAMAIVHEQATGGGGMQEWMETKSRNKIQEL